MPVRSALAGGATTASALAALGSPAAVSAARDLEGDALAATLTGFASWDVADEPADVVTTVAIRLGVTVLVAAVLCALAGRSRSRAAALVGGWGAAAVAAAAGGTLAHVHEVAVVLDGRTPGTTYLDGLVRAADAGAAFGVWTGWLVGAAAALATRPAPAAVPFPPPHPAAPTARHPAVEPPPPWWAPTWTAGDLAVRPGPTAFPPGGLGHEPTGSAIAPPPPLTPPGGQPPAGEATVAMTTASGDPHPSDPDGAPPVGLPPADRDPTARPPPDQDAGRRRDRRRR
ncbi:MAG TPA: hypothetical protein VFZ77_12890 [Acidimicrobiales bacterium]